jgi:membrane-bound lytic murein transglycosylase D
MRPGWIKAAALLTVISLTGCAGLAKRNADTASGADAAVDYRPSAALAAAPKQIDLWARLRTGFALPHPTYQNRITSNLHWYIERPDTIARIVDSAEPYLFLITEQVQQRNMPTELALLPVIESAYQPMAYSPSHAAGLWQFIPGTGRNFGLKQNWWYDGRRDILASTQAALDYLDKLHTQFNGDWLVAIAAYNCGEGAVQRAIDKNLAAGRPIDFWHLDLPEQTEDYVPRLLAFSALVDDPARYGISLRSIANQPALANVDVGSQIDLDVAANLADMPLEDLCRLNPGFNRMATDPNGPHQLLLPVDREQAFTERLADLSQEQRTRWISHSVCEGETLVKIARRYNTDTNLLRTLNKLSSNSVKVGDTLIIPRGDPRRNPLVPDSRLPRIPVLASAATQRTHTVAKGETLWSIARRNKLPEATLARLNNLKPGAALRPGQRLVMQGAAKTNRITTAQAGIKAIHYKIKRGETLALISRRFNVSVADLLRWNELSKHHTLMPGQKITVYVSA